MIAEQEAGGDKLALSVPILRVHICMLHLSIQGKRLEHETYKFNMHVQPANVPVQQFYASIAPQSYWRLALAATMIALLLSWYMHLITDWIHWSSKMHDSVPHAKYIQPCIWIMWLPFAFEAVLPTQAANLWFETLISKKDGALAPVRNNYQYWPRSACRNMDCPVVLLAHRGWDDQKEYSNVTLVIGDSCLTP